MFVYDFVGRSGRVRANAHFCAGDAGTSSSRQAHTFSWNSTIPKRCPERSPFTADSSSRRDESAFSPHIDWLQSRTKTTRFPATGMS
ncbi:hypothetical protein D3C83_66290 [compost metagenome]